MQNLYVLVCPKCSRRTVLPHQKLRGPVARPYRWPTAKPTLNLVCYGCDQLSVHSEKTVRLEPVETEAANLPPSALWQVTLACDQQDCGLPIVAHIQGETGLPRGAIAKKVYDAKPRPTCDAGHEIDPFAAVAEVKRWEWFGE